MDCTHNCSTCHQSDDSCREKKDVLEGLKDFAKACDKDEVNSLLEKMAEDLDKIN